ncbi:MAG: hypothetical protein ACRDNS_28805, partial [Trebonia sp.]
MPLPPLIVPAELVPSPQLMVAVKPAVVSAVSASVKWATVVLGGSAVPSVAALSWIIPASDPLATTALLWAMAVAVPGASSVRVTVTASVPGEAKLCEPVTVKVPFEPFTVPAELPPSPQAMLALK